jgi:hypothetical protein
MMEDVKENDPKHEDVERLNTSILAPRLLSIPLVTSKAL